MPFLVFRFWFFVFGFWFFGFSFLVLVAQASRLWEPLPFPLR